MKQGIYEISFEEYLALDALNNSTLKDMSRSPKYAKYRMTALRKTTPEQRIGTLVHMALLEPVKFGDKVGFLVEPDIRKNTKVGKLAVANAEEKGLDLYSQEEYDTAHKMAGEAKSVVGEDGQSVLNSLLRNGKTEQTIIWNDPKTGVLCKARPDYLRTDRNVLVDVKTISGMMGDDPLSEKSIRGYLKKYHGAWQAAWYLDGVQAVTGQDYKNSFVHIFIPKGDIIDRLRVIVLCDDDIEYARLQYHPIVEQYAECKKTGVWKPKPARLENFILGD